MLIMYVRKLVWRPLNCLGVVVALWQRDSCVLGPPILPRYFTSSLRRTVRRTLRAAASCRASTALLTSYEHAGAWSAAADDISATCHRRRPKIFLCPPIESSSRDSSITYIASPVSMRHSKSSYTYWIQFFKYKVFQKRRKHFSVHCVSKKRGVELFAITFINC